MDRSRLLPGLGRLCCVNSNPPKRERAPPGSPEYEEMVGAFVDECMRAGGMPLSAAECRAITIKTLDRYPGVYPRRVVP
jgi:hypothetical protein